MRTAEISGRLRALRARPVERGPRITRLSVQRLSAFADVEVVLDNAFLAICGGTGTGKSTLLLTIYAGVKSISQDSVDFRHGRISGFRVQVGISGPEGMFDEARDFAEDVAASDGAQSKVFLDSIDDRTDLSRRAAVTDIEALKEGVEGFQIDADALTFLRVICRKNYTRVTVYETEISDDRYYPHFEVIEGDVTYSSEGMGSGEHSAFYLAWRLSTAPSNSLVLIEEPEALLPPVAHEQMCAMISLFAQKRGLLPIFTTHSAGIVNFLGDGDVISLSRLAGETSLPSTTEGKSRVLSKLGLLAPKPILAFTEDEVGEAVLEELIDHFGFSDVLEATIIRVDEGAGGVKKILELLPSQEAVSGVYGFLDGDMEAEAKKWACRTRILFMPLSKAPEVEFLEALERNPQGFSERYDRPLARLERVLGQTRGADHHDRFREVAVALGFDVRAFTKVAFNHYLRVTGRREDAKRFARELAALTRVVPPDFD